MPTKQQPAKLTADNAPIVMPKKYLKKWLKNLRGGGYKKGKGQMYDPDLCSFCTLGVLQHSLTGGVEVHGDINTSLDFRTLPSKEWLEEWGIKFRDKHGQPDNGYCVALRISGGRERSITGLNDHTNLSFPKIADIIERNAVGI